MRVQVSPKEWLTDRKTIARDWHIWYRYEGKLVIVKGMNKEKDYRKRVELTKMLLRIEIENLERYGYNPITKTFAVAPAGVQSVSSSMSWESALQYARDSVHVSAKTLEQIDWMLRAVGAQAKLSHTHLTPLKDVTRRNIRELLDSMKLSARTFNAFRTYLIILYNKLDELELVNGNPVEKITKADELQRIRETLTQYERKRVVTHLREHHPDFYRFVQIFFHSGGRRSELIGLKVKDVDLPSQTYKTVVTKGKRKREVVRVIKDIALPFWIAQIGGVKTGQVFSLSFKTGSRRVLDQYATKYWKKHVKDVLGITADLYSLKHLNTDEVAAMLSIKDAAAMNSHTSTGVTKKHYAQGEDERQRQRIREVDNDL